MYKKGFTLIEIVVTIAILGMILSFVLLFMGKSYTKINNLKTLNDSFIYSDSLIYQLTYEDNEIDGSKNATDTRLYDDLYIKKTQTTIDGFDIEYELILSDINTTFEESTEFGYNFSDVEYEDSDNTHGYSGQKQYKGTPVEFTPNNEVFPVNAYTIENEPYGDPFKVDFTADPSKQPGLYYRMEDNDIPELGSSHLNYLKKIGNFIVKNDTKNDSSLSPHGDNDRLHFFPETRVDSLLNELKDIDPNNPIQIVHFEADTITYGGVDYSFSSVLMEGLGEAYTKQDRIYEFDLTKYFTSEETHLIFWADDHFDWSTQNKDYSKNDTYEFKVKGGHVYFISESGKHLTGGYTTGDIMNKFTVTPIVNEQTEDTMGQVTIANTKFIVGNADYDSYSNYRADRLEIYNMSDMKNIFFYLPFQEIYFKHTPHSLSGGIVARRVYGSNIDGEYKKWNGDPKVLGYGITDYDITLP